MNFKKAWKALFSEDGKYNSEANLLFSWDEKTRKKEKEFLYDFNGNFSGGFGDSISQAEEAFYALGGNDKREKPQKIQAKPIDVKNELNKIPTPFSLEGLEVKIDLLKSKIELSQNDEAKKELQGMIVCLENRKKFLDYKIFFDNFQTTDRGLIDDLLKKYELVMKPSDIFIPEFPAEAVAIMRKYTEVVKQITNKKPNFYVIATSDNFKSLDKKRDPILLAQSPFGFFWYILGAWDKEMMLLSEL